MRIHFILWGESLYGDCEFIELPGADGKLDTADDKYILIDGGYASSAGYSKLDEFLDAKIGPGGDLDFMVLSCAGADHYSGLSMVVDRYNVLNFYQSVRWPEGAKSGYDNLMNSLNAEGCGPDYEGIRYFKPEPGDFTSGPRADIGPVFSEGGKSWQGFDPNIEAKILAKNQDIPTASDDDNSWA
ncbi:MAG: hypothetical protein PF545_03145, partial [Elusimicrobia bacterium]|nr:hypothetical protein [Elusimicrobiota bacterium]